MKIKNEKGFVGIDAAIAIIAVVVFSGLIISLMYNNFLENVKIKREALASIYLTEIFENIAVTDYGDITQDYVNGAESGIISNEIGEQGFTVNLTVTEDDEEKITKKITATISYEVNDKKYEHTMERIKIKE